MGTNNSIFEFGDKFGIESPLGDWGGSLGEGSKPRLKVLIEDENLYKVRFQRSYPPTKYESLPSFSAQRAQTFSQLVALVSEAETQLIAAGHISVFDRIHILRGIYYGTPWSVDYSVERSEVRNRMFNAYLTSGMPPNPKKELGDDLFARLFNSAEVVSVGDGRGVDFGHLIIGLDARLRWLAHKAGFPFHGGASGLQICTWLGDIGGGAGMLAIRRTENPEKTALSMFKGSSFGGWMNLEGDVAGYLVGRRLGDDVGPPSLDMESGEFLSNRLADYLLIDVTEWKDRGKTFLKLLGAEFDEENRITNLQKLGHHIAGLVYEFGDLYMQNRLRQQGKLKINDVSALVHSSCYLTGAVVEMTQIFLHTLLQSLAEPQKRLEATLDLPVSPATLPNPKYMVYVAGANVVDWIQEQLEELW